MTTNYGERPGIVLDGDANYWRGKVAEVERERDAAREDAARLRAALVALLHAINMGVDADPSIWSQAHLMADSALAQSRATESGKDGAR